MIANMKATLVLRSQLDLGQSLRVEEVVWKVPIPVRGSVHFYKYRIALIDRNECVLRYDNEAGKGDHKHIGAEEFVYEFSSIRNLRRDFMRDVMEYMQKEAIR